ncbi:MAG: peptidoglycan DD-metalloendopeptidase family protein [Muribaculaceae bacterium]|nr:peptidoglycan DD-metalloendopeptidase family protein [Muribaculaceae bacterium]
MRSLRLPFIVAFLAAILLSASVWAPQAEARRKAAPARKEAPAPKKSTTKKTGSKKGAGKKKSSAPRTAGDVERDKKRTAGEIARAKKDIAANENNTRKQLNRLSRLDSDIRTTGERVDALQARVDELRASIRALSDTVDATQTKVDRLRASYGRNLSAMRRQRQGLSDIAFVFSAENFSGMVSRVRYLRELSAAQSERTRELRVQLDSLSRRRERLNSMEESLRTVLAGHKAENMRLQSSRKEASVLIDSLRREGSSLRKILTEKQELARRLDAELDRIIAEEARKAAEEEARRKKAAEEARRKAEAEAAARRSQEQEQKKDKNKAKEKTKADAPKSSPAKPAQQPAQNAQTKPSGPVSPLTGNFAANKGRLPAPVDRPYTIVSAFGRNSHPELSRIDVQNNGIDLRTSPGASARAVFAGTVSSIFRLDSYHNIVILRHGNYLTVYAGIDALKVRKGQEVAAGQLLGTLAHDPDSSDGPILHFEIRNEKAKLNPAEWLRK